MADKYKAEREEMEYHYDTHPQKRNDPHAEEREEMEYHYKNNPTRREQAESALERVRGAANRVIGGLTAEPQRRAQPKSRQPQKAQRRPEPGPVRSAFDRPMQDPFIRQIASGSGFGGLGSHPSRAQQAPPARAGTTIITMCDEYGNCTTKRIGGESRPRAPKRRGYAGTLGGDDPGFG